MPSKIFDFGVPTNYTLNNVQVVNGVASISPTNTPQVLTSDFSVPGDYTYNPASIQIAASQANLVDLRPANATFYADGSSFNANWGAGFLTGTPNGGAAIVSSKISLVGAGSKVFWSPVANADFLQTGTIRFVYTPNYSGTPVSDNSIISISQGLGNIDNVIQIEHSTDGNVYAYIADSSGTLIVSIIFPWVPVAGTSYEFELDFDITAGASRLFIDGTQQSATSLGTGTRTVVGQFLVGDNYLGTSRSPNFSISKLILFSTVQHVADYVPGAAISPTIYPLTNPTIQFVAQALVSEPELAAIVSVTAAITAAGSDAVQFAVSIDQGATYIYWNGAAWITSNLSFAQTNSLAVLNANLGALDLTMGNFELLSILHSNDGSTTPILQNVVVTYIDEPFTSGTILSNYGVDAQTLLNFLAAFTQTGSDTVTFALNVNSKLMYFNAGIWAPSNGTVGQTNSMATIKANLGSLLLANSTVVPFVFLQSGTGATAPTITGITIDYIFGAIERVGPSICIIYGFIRDVSGMPVVGANVKFSLVPPTQNGYMESESHVLFPSAVVAITDNNGYFEQPIVSSDQFGVPGTAIQVSVAQGNAQESVGSDGKPLIIQVPLQESADITALLSA